MTDHVALDEPVSRGPAGGPAMVAIAAFVSLGMVVRASQPLLTGPDPFWHLDLGRRIVNDWLPDGDPYSFLTQGQDWILNQWGTDLLIGVADSIGGLPLVAALALVLVGSTLLVTGRRMWLRSPSLITAGLFGLLVVVSTRAWGLRGNLFTLLLLPVLLGELERQRPRWHVLVPLFTVWANLHGGVLIGLGVLVVHQLARVISVRTEDRPALTHIRLLLACVGATLLTPYGPANLASGVRLALRGGRGITEWMPTPVLDPSILPYTVLVTVVLVALGVSAKPDDLPDVAVAVAAVLLGVSALRNIAPSAVILGVVGAPYVGRTWQTLRRRGTAAPRPPNGVDRGLAAAVLIGGLVAGLVVTPWTEALAAHVDDVPLATISRLKELDRPVRAVTASGWEGAVATLTGDHVRTAVDGRLELFRESQIQQLLTVHGARAGWEDVLADWCVTDVLARKDTPLAHALENDSQWQAVDSGVDTASDRASAAWFTARATVSTRACDATASTE